MPITDAFIIAAIVAAFAIFGSVLAWAAPAGSTTRRGQTAPSDDDPCEGRLATCHRVHTCSSNELRLGPSALSPLNIVEDTTLKQAPQ
jgi:hypothetical protein